MQVVVTGSSGPIGQALCSRLVTSGHHVVRVVRRPVRPGEVACLGPTGIPSTPVASKVLTRWSTWRAQVLATPAGPSPASGFSLRVVPAPLRCSWVRWPVSICRPGVLVSASAIGFYGDRGDEILTEQARPGDDFLASLCVRWRPKQPPRQRPASGWSRSYRPCLESGGARFPSCCRCSNSDLAGVRIRCTSGGAGSHSTTRSELLSWLLENDVRGPVNFTAPNPVIDREFSPDPRRGAVPTGSIAVPRFGPRLLLGSELADALLFTSARVQPAVLESSGFAFSHSDLETALRNILMPPAS